MRQGAPNTQGHHGPGRLLPAIRTRHDPTPPPGPQPRERNTPVPGDAAGHALPAHPLGVVLGLLNADAPWQITAPQNWPRWAVLLPHVLAATGGHLGSTTRQQPSG